MVNGTMGVGKSTVCNQLLKMLPRSVYLDGDWCWNMNPFVVSEETKEMVMDNITHLLRNYLQCSEYDYVIFCWVMQEERIIEEVLRRLEGIELEVHKITLMITEKALRDRLNKDIVRKIRTYDVIRRSVERLSLYENMDTIKIDVSLKIPKQIAKEIIYHVNKVT